MRSMAVQYKLSKDTLPQTVLVQRITAEKPLPNTAHNNTWQTRTYFAILS